MIKIKRKGSVVNKNNRWYVVLDYPRKEDGKRNQKWHSGHDTEEEAEEALIKLLHELNTGMHIEPTNITVREFMDKWLHDVVEHKNRKSTYTRYKSLMDRHIKPEIGGYKLSELRPMHIQSLLSEKLKSGNTRTGEGLSPKTVRMIYTVIHSALEKALKWQMVPRNVARAVEAPRKEEKEMDYLDPDQVKVFLREAKKDIKYYPVFLTAVMTGLRRGELLGLRWKDINFESKQLAVRKSLVRREGGFELTEPKSKSSRRTVAIPSIVVNILKNYRKKQNKRRLKYDKAYDDHDLIFARKDGSPMHPNTLLRHFKKILKKSDLPQIRFHDLRHTHATLMFSQNEKPKVISERLGHSRIGITLDRYSHVLPNMQRDAADRLEKALFS